MKKLQNNYTTPEQSKRLLELGIPSDSADCYITWKLDHTPKVNMLDNETYLELLDHISQITVPCWSVGRLIEINNMCYTSLVEQEYYIKMKDCNIDYMVNLFKLAINIMDFSKLEE